MAWSIGLSRSFYKASINLFLIGDKPLSTSSYGLIFTTTGLPAMSSACKRASPIKTQVIL